MSVRAANTSSFVPDATCLRSSPLSRQNAAFTWILYPAGTAEKNRSPTNRNCPAHRNARTGTGDKKKPSAPVSSLFFPWYHYNQPVRRIPAKLNRFPYNIPTAANSTLSYLLQSIPFVHNHILPIEFVPPLRDFHPYT